MGEFNNSNNSNNSNNNNNFNNSTLFTSLKKPSYEYFEETYASLQYF